jgi:hypothetical protein
MPRELQLMLVEVFECPSEAFYTATLEKNGAPRPAVQRRCTICITRWSSDLFFDLPHGAPCQMCLAGSF